MSRVSEEIRIMRAFTEKQRLAKSAKEGGFRCAVHPTYFLKAFRGPGGTVKFMCPACYREHDVDVAGLLS